MVLSNGFVYWFYLDAFGVHFIGQLAYNISICDGYHTMQSYEFRDKSLQVESKYSKGPK
jgi:hypothetical protein